jgi:hypothetical protein
MDDTTETSMRIADFDAGSTLAIAAIAAIAENTGSPHQRESEVDFAQ